MKSGAIDFIEKPFDYRQIVELVRECLRRDAAARAGREEARLRAERLATLTQREREVLERVIAGKVNRVIAEEMQISIKTVEAHRARIMEKLAVDSVAELVQATLGARPRERAGGGGAGPAGVGLTPIAQGWTGPLASGKLRRRATQEEESAAPGQSPARGMAGRAVPRPGRGGVLLFLPLPSSPRPAPFKRPRKGAPATRPARTDHRTEDNDQLGGTRCS